MLLLQKQSRIVLVARRHHASDERIGDDILQLLGLKSNLKSTPKHSIEVAKLDMKFKKTAEKLEAKKLDTQIYESRLTKYRDSLRSCLYDLHKARKELKIAVKDSKILVKEKIAEMKTNYAAIKADLKKMFKEMDLQYKSMIKSI